MAEYWNNFKEKFLSYWNAWSPNQKVLAAGGALFLVLALIMATWALTRSEEMEPLYTRLEANDAAGITEKLKEMKIPYELTDSGTTILVPPDLKYQTRLDLAAAGLPRGTVGFESLEEPRFGETSRDKEIKFNLALQGELARTIGHIQGIEQAWVYLTIPETALFTKDQVERTASVMVKINPGLELQPEQIKGIVHMVAKGVEGLKPENVTVIDINGRILSEDIVNANSQMFTNKLTANQLEIQKQFERDISQNIQSMLERVVGYGNAVVRVRAELDFDQKEIVDEQWGDRVPRSTQNTEEITRGQNAPMENVVGTDVNIPEYPAVNNQNTNFEQQKTTSIVNNEINRTETHQVVAPGAIRRLTVAVVVNGEQLPAERLTAIEQAARMAAGIQDQRGDQLTVSAVPFDTTYWERLQAQIDADARQAAIQKWGIIGGIILALLLIGVIAYMAVRRRRAPVLDTTIDEPILVEELLDIEETVLSPEEQEKLKMREQIESLAKDKPEEIAKLLQVWLAEDQR
jgi:flagellar M-ring protein FliF